MSGMGRAGQGPGLLRASWTLLRSELRQEFRRLELLLTASFFTLVLVVLFALSFRTLHTTLHPRAVPGMLWLAIFFVGVLTLTRIFEREREHATFEALLVAPIPRLSIYLSKLGLTLTVLGLCALVLIPGLAFIFPGADQLLARPLATFAIVAAGVLGYAAVGTLFAAGMAQHGGKNVLMSVILFPLSTPVLLLALAATRRLLEGHPDTWLTVRQMLAVDAGLVAIAALLFESVIVGTAQPAGSRSREPNAKPNSKPDQKSAPA